MLGHVVEFRVKPVSAAREIAILPISTMFAECGGVLFVKGSFFETINVSVRKCSDRRKIACDLISLKLARGASSEPWHERNTLFRRKYSRNVDI